MGKFSKGITVGMIFQTHSNTHTPVVGVGISGDMGGGTDSDIPGYTHEIPYRQLADLNYSIYLCSIRLKFWPTQNIMGKIAEHARSM